MPYRVEAFCTLPEADRDRLPDESWSDWWHRDRKYRQAIKRPTRTYDKLGHAAQFIAHIKRLPHWDYRLYESTAEWVQIEPPLERLGDPDE